MKQQQSFDAMTVVNSPCAGRVAGLRRTIAITFILTLVLVPMLGRRTLVYDKLPCGIKKAPASTAGSPLPALQGGAAISHLKEQGLYGSLREAVKAARYGFYQESKQSADWLAENPAQGLRARFTLDGLQIETGDDGPQTHRLAMKLRSAGYGERQMTASAVQLTADSARAEIRYELQQSAITEWYHDTAAGLEQGFTLESAPGERRDGERLRLSLAMEGDLRAETVDGGQALRFKGDREQRALRYDHLVVKDAGGRELQARMAVNREAGEVRLEVDDRDAVWPVTIDPTFTQEQKLLASDAAQGDWFGESLAISGDTVVVGSPIDDGAAGSDQGSAYVFVRSDGVWIEQQKLLPSDETRFVMFGWSVAISGDTVVVSAPNDSGPWGLDRGSAYVFVRSGGVWSEQQKLLASDSRLSDQFGYSVAISGETIVVGAPTDLDAAWVFRGAAYVFVRIAGVWSEQRKLQASDAGVNDFFGDSVAISGDTIVVGSFLDDDAAGADQGAAYVFAYNGEIWIQQQKLLPSDATAGIGFGQSVAIGGDTVVVGVPGDPGPAGNVQGSAYVFARSGGVWTQQQKLRASDAAPGDEFGWSVAISGETVVVGAPADDAPLLNQGSAYVFARSDGVWTEQQKFLASDAAASDEFGWPVAISGETVVVGARMDDGPAGADQGSAYVFGLAPTDTPPAITAASLFRTQGVPASTSNIAAVDDAEDDKNTLSVTVNGAASATVNGVTICSISVDASGQVTAIVGAACDASNASFTLRVTDSSGLFTEATLNVTVTPETTPPVLTCPSNVIVTLPPNSMDTGMVVNYPAPVATDNCTASPTITTSSASGMVFPVGGTTINVIATDAANNQSTCSFTVTVLYNFNGFLSPVANPPVVNVVNAGQSIPLKFSLSGNKGLNIFEPGYPTSYQISCDDGAPTNENVQAVLAKNSGLSYNAATDTYTYVWKTDSLWERQCRKLILRLNDGSERVALFKFR